MEEVLVKAPAPILGTGQGSHLNTSIRQLQELLNLPATVTDEQLQVGGRAPGVVPTEEDLLPEGRRQSTRIRKLRVTNTNENPQPSARVGGGGRPNNAKSPINPKYRLSTFTVCHLFLRPVAKCALGAFI